MYRTAITAFILTLFALRAMSQAPDKAGLDTLLTRLARHQKLMGYVQLSRNGTVVYAKGFGEARPGVPNDAATVFRIGSISKVFTAALVMQQVDAGRLRLDDRLGKWFPEIPNAAAITVDQMLRHRSGIHSITDDSTFLSWQDTVNVPGGVLRRMAQLPADFEPGSKSSYSNSNYILLGYILEKVSGKSYAKVLRDGITGPLKLKSTGIGPRTLPAKGHDAASFRLREGHWEADELTSTDVAGAAGGIAGTVPELAMFIRALMQGKVVSAAGLEKMLEIEDGFGRGLMRFPFYERQAYGHNGRIDNFSSSVAYFPKDSTVLSVVCNGVNYNTNDLLIGVLSLYYGKPYKIPDYSAAPVLTKAQLERLDGTYANAQIGMDIKIVVNGNGITAQATGQGAISLDPVSATVFTNEGVGVELEFPGTDAAPAPVMMLKQGGANLSFKRKN